MARGFYPQAMTPLGVLDLVLLLLGAAVPFALAARLLHIPRATGLVLGGMALALVPGVPAVTLDPALAMALFLPPLLQGSAYFTVWRDFRANLRPILLLAIGCVAFTTFAVGVAAHLLLPVLPWAACFALGAIVSPPDAVAASSVVEHLHLPPRLVTVLEGESLVNDATGLVLYRFAVVAALTGVFDPTLAAASFVGVAVGGIVVGIACGWLTVQLLRRLHDTNLEIAASFLVSWASYLAAEALGASGVLSTVACGLVLGRHRHAVFSSRTRLEARATWSFAMFVLDALVFVLIGLSLHGVLGRLGPRAWSLLPMAAAVTATMIAARFVWIYPGTYLPRFLSPRLRARDPYPPVSMPTVLAWAGMRGVVSLAAALALPAAFPGRDAILFLTFVAILATLLIQGPTLAPLIRLLGVSHEGQHHGDAAATARAAVVAAKLSLLEERAADPLEGAIARDLLAEFRIGAAAGGAGRAERLARLSLRLETLTAGRAALLDLHRAQRIHESVVDTLEQELDLEELRARNELGRAG